MLDQETWRFINTFAPWFSAAGTTASVIVALYLARRSSRERVRVTTGIYIVGAMGQRVAHGPSVVQICATNTGSRAVTVMGIFWRTGVLRRRTAVQIPSDFHLSTPLPARLEYGQQATLLFLLEDLRRMPDPVGDTVRSSRFPRLAVRFVRAGVYTTNGRFVARVDKSIRREILEGRRRAAEKRPA